MKNIYILLVLMVIGLVGCNDDFLEVAPRDQLSESTFWRNEDDAIKASIGVYAGWVGSEVAVRARYLGNTWSDDAITTGFWNGFYYNIWGLGNISPTQGQINELWNGLYNSIRRANIFLDNIDRPAMDETVRKRLEGEVRFIRAFQYHILVNNFGGVPLVDTALGVDELNIPRSSEEEIIAFILDDLDKAIPNLPKNASETGKITKGAALSLKARVLLYNKQWKDAAIAAKEVMDLGVHQLFKTPTGDGYQQQFATANNNNPEQIVAWQYLAVIRGNEKPGLLAGAICQATKALADAYDTYDVGNDQLIAQDPNNITVNRDPRFNFSIGFDGTGAYTGTVKFSLSDVESTNVLIRYAEVLLTYAEAKIEANDIDPSVLQALNEVRARAYGVASSDIANYPEITTIIQADLRDIVRNERRVELAFEGLRWFDVRRWGIGHGSNGTMNGVAQGVDGVSSITRAIEEKDYYRPIPQQQIDLTAEGVLEQNPGY